ncbi:MAG: zinc ribbon domain-containing protein [Anaerolineales bacterium]|nr:zinc ribbon domain-containing protein [Anaerolineales bacterium]
MSLTALLLLSVVVAASFYFIWRPLPAARRLNPSSDHERSFLLAERERLLRALQELDFDYALGKVPEEDYPTLRAELLRRGGEVVRQLEAMQIPMPAFAPVEATPALSDDEIELLIARRRSERRENTGGFCPQCGKPVLLSDRFCSRCGRALKG